MCRNFDLRFLLFYYLLSKFFFSFFSVPFHFFFLSVLLSFLLLSNWFLFLSSFVFPLLFRHYFIPIYLTHVVSSLVYPNLLGTKMLDCCCCYLWDSNIKVYACRTNMHYNKSIGDHRNMLQRAIQKYRYFFSCSDIKAHWWQIYS
jgi:hypothetical protein